MIHFFKIEELSGGKRCFTTLSGQKLGKDGVSSGTLVKADKKITHRFQTIRSTGEVGQIFYTSSLKKANGCYAAADIAPISILDGYDGDLCLDLNAKLDWDLWKVRNGGGTERFDVDVCFSDNELRGKIDALMMSPFINGEIDLEFYVKMGVISDFLFSRNGNVFTADNVELMESITVLGTNKNMCEAKSIDHMSGSELKALYKRLVVIADNARRLGFAVRPYGWKKMGEKIYVTVSSGASEVALMRGIKSHCIDGAGALLVDASWLFEKRGIDG